MSIFSQTYEHPSLAWFLVNSGHILVSWTNLHSDYFWKWVGRSTNISCSTPSQIQICIHSCTLDLSPVFRVDISNISRPNLYFWLPLPITSQIYLTHSFSHISSWKIHSSSCPSQKPFALPWFPLFSNTSHLISSETLCLLTWKYKPRAWPLLVPFPVPPWFKLLFSLFWMMAEASCMIPLLLLLLYHVLINTEWNVS